MMPLMQSLDRIKCRLLEGTNAQEVRAMVLDMQARLLLDMLGKGIESALINPSALVPEPWQASGETLSGIDPEAMAVEPALVSSIQVNCLFEYIHFFWRLVVIMDDVGMLLIGLCHFILFVMLIFSILSSYYFHVMQAYVDAVLDLASHFITRLRRYASFCRTLASHAVTAGTGSNRNMVTSPTQSSAAPVTNQGWWQYYSDSKEMLKLLPLREYLRKTIKFSSLFSPFVCLATASLQQFSMPCFSGGQSGTTNSTGSTQMQAWVQGAIAKISSTTDGVSSSAPNPISGPSTFMPISINTGTFPGTPAVRLIGDCHFLHRLCQLLLFCFFFRRTQLPRFVGGAQRHADANVQKPQTGPPGKVEEVGSAPTKPSSLARPDENQASRSGQIIPGAKGVEEGTGGRLRLGTGNAGQGYTFEEVKTECFYFVHSHFQIHKSRMCCLIFLVSFVEIRRLSVWSRELLN